MADDDDYVYEEAVLLSPHQLKNWWRYLSARSASPFEKRAVIYERAIDAIPGSYKLWRAYLLERLESVSTLPITHSQYLTLNHTFERALGTMHKMPRIWIMYLQSLIQQKLITKTRRAFDRALLALPVTQHDRVWEYYVSFVSQKGVPIQTSRRVYHRYLKYDPSHVEDLIELLVYSELWQEAAERLAVVLNDDLFCSIKGKTKHRLWLELCEILTLHAREISGLNVDAIIRGGITKFTDEVGRLWTSLADYYVRRGLYEKARDIFEEGMSTVTTVRDFAVVFDAYAQFEESVLSLRMEITDVSDQENGPEREEGAHNWMDIKKFKKSVVNPWCIDNNDLDLRLARLAYLMDRRPGLANSVLLRQNPHNVEQWHRRVNLFKGNPTKQILTYTEAVRTVDPMKAVGKPHTLWVAFARLYETHKDAANARVIFDKAVQVNYKDVDHLASVWCEWAEMELRLKNFDGALELVRRATAEPSVEVKRRVAVDPNESVQSKIHKSLRLWTFYTDLDESLGSLESTRKVYERILDLKIATPQIIINYAMLLEENNYFEDALKVYERGVKIFEYPHVVDIWVTYLSKFVKRYGKSKLERARELFEHAVEKAPAKAVRPLYLQFAKLEEEYGMAKRAMHVYDRATKAVPGGEKLGIYGIYIARAIEIFGVPKAREIYEQAIEAGGLPEQDVKVMCIKYAELEKSLGEVDRGRALYKHASRFADPRSDPDFWNKWRELEVQHGNEGTFREMLRVKRSVSASYSQILPKETLKEAKDVCDEIVQQLSCVDERDTAANVEDIELSSESEDVEKEVERIVAHKDVPEAVFGELTRKRKEDKDGAYDAQGKRLRKGALEISLDTTTHLASKYNSMRAALYPLN